MTTNKDRADGAMIELWTARDMDFVIDRSKGIHTIPRFTKCEKPPYTTKIKRKLKNMEEKNLLRPDGAKAVCVQLKGMLRYVWRTDVLTRSEYERAKEEDKSRAASVFRSKL